MLSRAAESIYWLHRYIERAENVARFIDVNLHLMLDLTPDSPEQWQPLVNTTGDRHDFARRYGTATKENVFTFLTHDTANPNSILSCLQAARDNARSVREIISSDMWEHVNKFYLMVQRAVRQAPHAPHDFFTEVKNASYLFVGITDATMAHGEGWHFGRLGRLLERADKTSRILDVKYFILLPKASDVGSPVDDIQWAAVLKSASALEMYRQRFGRITPLSVADFLVLDREFPRALHYCLVEAETSLHLISGTPMGSFRDEAEQRLGRLRSELDYAAIQEIISVGLHEFLDRFQFKLNQVDDEIFNTFFAMRPASGPRRGEGMDMAHHVMTRDARTAVRTGLFAGYSAPDGSYDEMFAEGGEPRPHWQKVSEALEALGPRELAHCWQQARRMIHENGVTYNVYDDARGMERPWELDPVPWVIGPDEWERLEAALAQRARLLNAVLADVYGPQRLLTEGLLPPELVFAHPGFLRPCHGLAVPNDSYLHAYAADLARTPDGQWWVLADRAQSPAGSGYALENRQVLSNILPEVLRDCQVQRLASYFAALRQTLHDAATRHRDNPRIVLLTPGPYNETYFEHAYLARYLGYTLVEGGDLTVRDERVYLKTLAGLEPVDVILRRLDDAFCDPLELNQASLLGTAGLVQAVRAGNVSVVNTLGSGWLESAALMPFLPVLCRRLLDEELALPSAPTWWCGDTDSSAYVLDHLEELVVMPMRSSAGRGTMRGDRLSRDERRELVDMVRARPYEYAAQQHLSLSSLPVWNDVGVQPRQTVLRTYAVAERDTYKVMSGGLARISASDGPPAIAMQGDSGSKDTWVLCKGEPDTLTLLPPAGQPIALRRSGYEFPSRAADNLFWIGRHSERAEGLARLLRSLLVRLNDESGLKSSTAFPVLFRAVQAWGFGHLTAPAEQPDGLASRAQALLAILFDPQAAHSVRAILGTLHRVAASVRDYMTLESWRIITHLDEDFDWRPLANHVERLPDALALIDHTIMMLSAFSGLMEENMIRGPQWHFLDLGRRLERAAHTTGLLRSTLVDADDREGSVLEALLEIGDSSITYRSRYLTALQCVPVLDLLLTDDSNPRAVVYQLVRLADHVERLPRDRNMPSLSPTQRRVVAMLTRLRLAEIEVLCRIGRNGRRGHLETALAELQADFSGLSDTITHHYLSHAELTRHLALTGG